MGFDYFYLAVIMIDSALKNNENYYPHIFLKECKYFEKEAIRGVTEDIEIFSRDFDEEYIKVDIMWCFWESNLWKYLFHKEIFGSNLFVKRFTINF